MSVIAGAQTYAPLDMVRVDVPDYPGAIVRSSTGAVLPAPPTDGTAWRPASIPELDRSPAVEALQVTNADLWHLAGRGGAGVKVAVFDTAWFGGDGDPREVEPFVTHDCAASVTCSVPFDPDHPALTGETGVHGWACAEVIRDLAPEAELHLVRTNSFTAYENAVAWAIREGVDIISMSMSYYNDSFYDGGGPHAALMEDLEAHGVLMVTSAGNNAAQHWTGPLLDVDGDGRLDVDGDNGLWLYLPAGEQVVYVNWNQHDRCGVTDLDAWVFAEDGRVIGSSQRDQDPSDEGSCQPVERVLATVPEEGWVWLEVRHRRGVQVGVSVDVLTRAGYINEWVASSSLTDPAAHPLAFAVGAVPASDYWSGEIEAFSARGPNHAGHPKPDIAGPDGLSTAAYGPVGFYGTSASTPAVAGLIALIMGEAPELTPREAAVRLQGWALFDAPRVAPDSAWGAGKARLPVPQPGPVGCGRGPLLLPLFFLPLAWFRRRERGPLVG